MLWKVYAANAYPHPVYALTVLGTIALAGTATLVGYGIGRTIYKRGKKRGHGEGVKAALRDPEVFDAWVRMAIDKGFITVKHEHASAETAEDAPTHAGAQ